ncbi:MAG TPA: PAS domain S-box protein [Bacteroidales bacterium]|nr:PAS domain S-box protein [Bacteroidales bacterium]
MKKVKKKQNRVLGKQMIYSDPVDDVKQKKTGNSLTFETNGISPSGNPHIDTDHLRLMIEYTHLALVLLDLEGYVIEFNQKAKQLCKKLTGKTLLPETHLKTYLIKDNESILLSRFEEAGEGKTAASVFKFDYEGTDNWYELRFIPVINMEQTKFINLEISDITEQYITALQLQKNESQLNAIFSFAGVGIGLSSLEGKWLRCNEAMCEMTGFTEEELLNMTISDLTHPADRDITQEHLDDVVSKTISNYRIEKRYLRKNNTWFWADVSVTPLLDSQGDIQAYIGIFSDITTNKNAEKALKLTQSTVDHASVSIVWLNTDGKLIYANNNTLQYLQYSREELLNMFIWQLDKDYNKQKLQDDIEKLRRKESLVMERIHRTKTGDQIPVQVVANLFVQNDETYICTFVQVITERKKAELALKESEEWFRQIFDQSPVGIAIVSLDQQFVRENQMLGTILGAEQKDFSRIKVNEIVHNDDRDLLQLQFNQLMLGEIAKISLDLRCIRFDGPLVWIRMNIRSLSNANGNIVQMLLIMEDITSRKNTEQALKESEDRFRKFFDEDASVKLLVDPDSGIIKDANKAAVSFYGYNREQLVKMKISDLNRLPQRVMIKELVETKVKATNYFERTHWLSKGASREVEIYATSLNIDHHIFLFYIIHDVTSRKVALEALRISEERYRVLFEHSAIPIWEEDFSSVKKYLDELKKSKRNTDLRNYLEENPDEVINLVSMIKVSDVNQKSVEFFEVEEKGKLIRNLVNNFTSEMLDVYREEMLVLAEGKTSFSAEIPVVTGSGKNKVIAVNLFVTPGFEPTLSRVLVSFVDVTTRVKVQKELQESVRKLNKLNATKDRFFSIIAHDLKNPFNSILGYAELLRQNHKKYDNEKRELLIQNLFDSSTKAYELLENLLDWARSQLGRLELRKERINLPTVVQEVTSALAMHAFQKNISISTDIDQNMYVVGDTYVLQTILRNLLSNAIKFTGEDGTVRIEAYESYNLVNIVVKDTGIGIPVKIQDKLFSLEGIYTTKGTGNERGTGLGLLLCAEFVEKLGGTIRVKSKPGEGSTFNFTVPKK